jgi:hypothetical protein
VDESDRIKGEFVGYRLKLVAKMHGERNVKKSVSLVAAAGLHRLYFQ